MIVVHALAAGFLALVCSTLPAVAGSILNRDDTEHSLTIVENGKTTRHVLKRDGALEGVCPKGCIVRLGDGDEKAYRLQGNEIIAIDGGVLYYTGPAPETEPPDGEKSRKQ